MSRINRCRVGGCRSIASTVIGHTTKQVHMCATCARIFREGAPQTQRVMLASARPPETFNASARYVNCQPWFD